MNFTIPLSIYIHFPWCISKCPYCDFNSYAISDKNLIESYIYKLLIDIETEVKKHEKSKLTSIYFGGGTPSLLLPEKVVLIIQHIKNYFFCTKNIEVTLEANPGTINLKSCQEFKDAGINRFSLGVQSFNDEKLKSIKRAHSARDALTAIEIVKQAGFTNFNLDLMYGLPEQDVISAKSDLMKALSFKPPHISWYQLTVNSKFLPNMPREEELWNIQQVGQDLLSSYSIEQYEVSAYCKSPDYMCKHNINYWQYGDYIGIGAGAHSKLTFKDYTVKRYAKISNPYKYTESNSLIEEEETVAKEKIPLEFMLNALRLYQPITNNLFQERTGLTFNVIEKQLEHARNLGLIDLQNDAILTTDHGKNFLDDLLEIFL